ncbi:GxxExxY protein [Brunnivagina elsteri]
MIGCAMRVHTVLGAGLLESAYEECLYYELKKKGLKVNKQVPLPLVYEEVQLDCVYRLDLMVEIDTLRAEATEILESKT